MRIRPATFVAAPLVLAVAFTSTAVAQEQEVEREHAEVHAEHQKADQERQAREGMTVELASVNDSGVEGKAKIARAEGAEGEDAHQVKIRLTGTEEGQSYPAHVHRGSCAEGGPVVTGLSPVEAGEEYASSATIVTASDLAMEAPAGEAVAVEAAERAEDEAEYVEARAEAEAAAEAEAKAYSSLFIQVHAPDGAPIACGDIPAKKADRGAKKGGERSKDKEKDGEREY